MKKFQATKFQKVAFILRKILIFSKFCAILYSSPKTSALPVTSRFFRVKQRFNRLFQPFVGKKTSVKIRTYFYGQKLNFSLFQLSNKVCFNFFFDLWVINSIFLCNFERFHHPSQIFSNYAHNLQTFFILKNLFWCITVNHVPII